MSLTVYPQETESDLSSELRLMTFKLFDDTNRKLDGALYNKIMLIQAEARKWLLCHRGEKWKKVQQAQRETRKSESEAAVSFLLQGF